LRGAPREVRDLVAAARNSWQVCFDNLSHLPQDLADAACRLVTGGGFGGRELYGDFDEAVFDATRPLVFNAIPDLGASRSDFLDRALIIEFQDIKPRARRDEHLFWKEFEAVRPRILGALLDAAVCGMRTLPNLTIAHLPRMADFAIWASACEDGLGWAVESSSRSTRAIVSMLATLRWDPLPCTNRCRSWLGRDSRAVPLSSLRV
jgi:hypothetical protein